MNIFTPLYKLSLLKEDLSYLKSIIEICINKGDYLGELNKYVPYTLGQKNSEYVDQIYEAYIFDHDKGVKICEIIYDYILNNQDYLSSNAPCRIFMQILSEDKKLVESKIIVDKDKYEALINLQSNNDIFIEEYDRKNKARIENLELKIKNLKRDIQVSEKKSKMSQVQLVELTEEIYYEIGKNFMYNKSILVLCDSLINSETSNIKKQYRLDRILIQSSIHVTPKLKDNIKNSDIVVISTSQAKHEVDRLVSNHNNYFRTSKNNLNLIFSDTAKLIGKRSKDTGGIE